MIKVALFLLLNCWVVPAWADPSDVLLDDFGEPIAREGGQAILPPVSQPKGIVAKKPTAPKGAKQDPAPLPTPVKPAAPAPAVAKAKIVPPAPAKKPVAPKTEEPAAADVEIFGGTESNPAAVPKTAPKVTKADQPATILPPVTIKIVPPLPGMVAPATFEKEEPKIVAPKVAKVPEASPAPEIFEKAPDPTPAPIVEAPKVAKVDSAPAPEIVAPKADKVSEPAPVVEAPKVTKAPLTSPAAPKPSETRPNESWVGKTQPQVNIFIEPNSGVNRAKKGDMALRPKAEVQAHPEEEEINITRDDDDSEKKDGRPVAKVPPAPNSDVEIFGEGQRVASGGEISAGTGAPADEEETDQSATGFQNDAGFKGKLDQRPVAKVVPVPGGAIFPPPSEREQIAKLPPPRTAHDREAVIEHLPIDINAYIDMSRTPNFIRINAHGYNIRNSPEFQTGRKDNIYDQNVAGSFYAVTRIKTDAEGVATGILVDGQERWVFMPWEKRNDFQYCESEACFADIKLGLEALTKPGSVDTASLLACGITGVDYEGRPVIEHLPRNIDANDLPPQTRSAAELEELNSRVDHSPKVRVAYGEDGCVVDSRNRSKPNFRGARTTRELKKSFIDYMTPYALEVQEATGLPAAVIIGQAALESRWGQSGLFTNTQNIFGHSCWREGRTQTIELKMGRDRKRISGSCDTPRPTGGYYLNFRNPQDSIYAYAANLLTTDHNYYPGVRAAVNRAKPEPADWREVVSGLREYDSPNPEYRSLVRSIILSNDLGKLENKKLCR
ncbi:MAG: glucosaminidase domain-containing protein [Bdellovibrionota bacterium]